VQFISITTRDCKLSGTPGNRQVKEPTPRQTRVRLYRKWNGVSAAELFPFKLPIISEFLFVRLAVDKTDPGSNSASATRLAQASDEADECRLAIRVGRWVASRRLLLLPALDIITMPYPPLTCCRFSLPHAMHVVAFNGGCIVSAAVDDGVGSQLRPRGVLGLTWGW
jgi:hypothetical protein